MFGFWVKPCRGIEVRNMKRGFIALIIYCYRLIYKDQVDMERSLRLILYYMMFHVNIDTKF